MRRALPIAALVCAWSATALAHPTVDRARALLDEGSFEEAEAALAEAEAATDLERDDLIALLEARALLHHAQRRETELDHALLALASIEPTHRFDERYPPDLAEHSVEVGRRIHGRLQVAVELGPSPVGTRLSARAMNDPADLVREVRIRVFDAESGQWRTADPPVEAAGGRSLMAFVELIGPGDIVLASEGSPDAPIRVVGPQTSAGPSGSPLALGVSPPTEEAEGGSFEWGWIVLGVVGAAVLAAIIGGSIYGAENPSHSWQPSVPTFQTGR